MLPLPCFHLGLVIIIKLSFGMPPSCPLEMTSFMDVPIGRWAHLLELHPGLPAAVLERAKNSCLSKRVTEFNYPMNEKIDFYLHFLNTANIRFRINIRNKNSIGYENQWWLSIELQIQPLWDKKWLICLFFFSFQNSFFFLVKLTKLLLFETFNPFKSILGALENVHKQTKDNLC